jgi:hypothetical protein
MDAAIQHEVLLQRLAQNEESIAELYRIFADKFPRHRDFWAGLAGEEIQHARWIHKLAAREGSSVAIDATRFDDNVFAVAVQYLKETVQRAKVAKQTLKEALTVSLDIETGMLERGYFTVFKGDARELIEILEHLRSETEKHTDKIRKELARKRWLFF